MYESRDLQDMIDPARTRCISFVARAETDALFDGHLKIIVCCTLRDAEKQNALYQVGRRGIAGEHILTNAKGGESFHQYGVAFDIFPLYGGKPVANLSDPIWQRLGEIGKEEGLEWGGDWHSFPEGPHFQYTGGLTIKDLQNGSVPADQS